MKPMEKTKKDNSTPIIHLQFFEAVDGKIDYYFGSLKAMYMKFTEEQIGIKLNSLYAYGLDLAKPKVTDKCIIRKEMVERAPQKEADNE